MSDRTTHLHKPATTTTSDHEISECGDAVPSAITAARVHRIARRSLLRARMHLSRRANGESIAPVDAEFCYAPLPAEATMPVASDAPASAPSAIDDNDDIAHDASTADDKLTSAPAHLPSSVTIEDNNTATESPMAAAAAAVSAVALPTAAQYAVDLLQSFPEVCQKAKSGVQTCHAVAAFVHERANMETAYAKALQRIAQNAQADDWAPQLSSAWHSVQQTLEGVAADRQALAATIQRSMATAVRAFASQQELQVQRLIAEGTKVRQTHQQLLATLHRAKDKYDRKCADATDVVATLRTLESAAASGSSSASGASVDSSPVTATRSDVHAVEIAEKLTTGAGQLLTKMWDSTSSSFGKSALERQRIRVESCLDDVVATERLYVQAVDALNAFRPMYDRDVADNLLAFQLTEEQRIEYLKDLLMRQQRAVAAALDAAIARVAPLRESVYAIDEIADMEDAFKRLAATNGSECDPLDIATNAFTKRMQHIQALSAQGHAMVVVVASSFTDLIRAEDAVLLSLQKQLRLHDTGDSNTNSSADLFSVSSTQAIASYVADEGATMRAGWQVARDQAQLLLNVHQEFRSLLAEPVSLSLSTMRQQYERARTATHDNCSKAHATLHAASSSHAKRQHKREAKARDVVAAIATVQDVVNGRSLHLHASLNAATLTAEDVVVLMQQHSYAISADRRNEAKLRNLVDELRDLQQRVSDSEANLKQAFHTYIQDVEVFVSVYMKNEKYRLQIQKSSLLAFVKAFEHQLTGASAVVTRATAIIAQIDPTSDVQAFVQQHRHEPSLSPSKHSSSSTRVVPAFHTNDVLKDALSEYYRIKAVASAVADDRRLRSSPNVTSNVHLSTTNSLQTLRQEPLALDLDVIASSSGCESVASDSLELNNETSPVQHSELELSETAAPLTSSSPPAAAAIVSDAESESQALAMSDFQKKFQLEHPEPVVESYSCALYLSNFPYHGRLYLTRDHICFTGWRDTIFVASYLDITSIEKKNTALIVPNAIELVVNSERIFIASFVFRDECFQCIQQLQAIKRGTMALLTTRAADASASNNEEQLTLADTSADNTSGKNSPVSIAAVAPTPQPQEATTATAEAAPAPIASPPARIVCVPERDARLDEYEIILDDIVHISVDFAFSTLWVRSTTFYEQLLLGSGETNIHLTNWTATPTTLTPVATPETFDGTRRVTFIHNKKYMVGPSAIPTTQEQRYRLEADAARLVISSSSTVTDVPYCDYFRAESRWVLSATATAGESHLQVGLRIHWLKSTWLKKQIESAAVSEARETAKTWLTAALKASTAAATTTSEQRVESVASIAGSAAGDDSPVLDENVKSAAAPTAAAPVEPVLATLYPPHRAPMTLAATAETTSLSLALQVAALCCLLLFMYTLHRICVTLEHMEALTRASLLQQQQQQTLLKDVVQAFLARERLGQ